MIVNQIKSKSLTVQNGVPQGSTLGPILFAVYTNDLPDVERDNCIINIFADDTALYSSGDYICFRSRTYCLHKP